MAGDDWRIRIELEAGDTHGFLHRLGIGLGEEARELAQELQAKRLAVSADEEDNEVFVYTATRGEAEQALKIVEAELAEGGLTAKSAKIEHWLTGEDRWDDEPPGPDIDEEVLARGYSPWEVRVECDSHEQARKLAD